jgi:hypothetical protein
MLQHIAHGVKDNRMEVKYNNTAGRLLAIFERLRQRSVKQKEVPLWQAWHLAITPEDTNGGSPEAVLQQLAAIVDALAELELRMKEEKGDSAQAYVTELRPLRQAMLATGLMDSCGKSATVAAITPERLQFLEICANELPKEGVVPEDELDEIAKAVQELFDQVKDSGIRHPLKRWILELLSSIKKSIDNYHILGAKALRQSLVTIAGEVGLYADALNDIKKQDSTILDKLGQVFHKVHGLVLKAKEYWPLIEASGKVLRLPFLDEDGSVE